MAKDVTISGLDVFSNKLAVEESGWRTGNIGLQAETREDFEADAGAAINADAAEILVRAAVESEIEPFDVVAVLFKLIFAVVEAKINILRDITNNQDFGLHALIIA